MARNLICTAFHRAKSHQPSRGSTKTAAEKAGMSREVMHGMSREVMHVHDMSLVCIMTAECVCMQVESLRERTRWCRRRSLTEEGLKASRQENVRAGGKTNTGRFQISHTTRQISAHYLPSASLFVWASFPGFFTPQRSIFWGSAVRLTVSVSFLPPSLCLLVMLHSPGQSPVACEIAQSSWSTSI